MRRWEIWISFSGRENYDKPIRMDIGIRALVFGKVLLIALIGLWGSSSDDQIRLNQPVINPLRTQYTNPPTMASKQPPTKFPEIKQLTADDPRYFTPSGARYEDQIASFTEDLRSKLKGYVPETKHITVIEAAHKKHINDVYRKSTELQADFMKTSRTAKFIGVVLGVWAVWELYVGAKWILKKWVDHEAREQGLIRPSSPPPWKRQRIHSRDWQIHTDNDI